MSENSINVTLETDAVGDLHAGYWIFLSPPAFSRASNRGNYEVKKGKGSPICRRGDKTRPLESRPFMALHTDSTTARVLIMTSFRIFS